MSALQKLQGDFQHCVLSRSSDMHGQVVGTARAGASERVDVYVEGYRLRLLEVLEDNFPGLRALLGNEEFDRCGRAYIDAHPSRHPSVREFSRQVSAFLRRHPDYSSRAALAEMADFELAQADVFDAADAEIATIETLASLSPESWPGMRFTLHPSARTLALSWNIPAVWSALDQDEEPESLAAAEEPTHWLLWRRELNTHWRSLGADEAWALQAVREGADFAALCEGLCQWHEESDVALQAASLLKRWITDGVISHIETT